MPEYRVKKYTSRDRVLWEEFVRESNNGTIFHTQKFLSYHPEGRFKNHHLIITKNDKPAALITGADREDDDGKRIFASYPGASFGGFIFKKGASLEETKSVIEMSLEYMKEKKYDRFRVTLPCIFYCGAQNNNTEFIFSNLGFKYQKRELSSVSTLNFREEDVEKNFNSGCRRAVNKARKSGVEVKITSDYKQFYKILKKNLNLRHNVEPAHSESELIKLSEMFPEDIVFFGAYLGKKLLGGIVMFVCNKRVSMAFYISQDYKYQEYRPVNLLFSEVLRWSVQKGFSYLDFGLFTVNMDPNWGLCRFKESFGAQPVFREYFYLDLK
ncbi:MAG: GNAT family N-acetyltransferase [Fibrobacterota bacterium]